MNDIKILAIDDNQDNLTILKAVISNRLPGNKFLGALNGMTGLELARIEDPDVILLDIAMPEMDGFTVCQKLKEDEGLKTIPVIFLTAINTDSESRLKALAVGAEGFLSKPYDVIELIAQIQVMARIKAANRFQRLEKEHLAVLVAERTRELEQELTGRKRAEEALRESEERYRELFNNAYLAIFQNTPEGKILAVNPEFARIFGFDSPTEVIATGNNAADLFVDPKRREEIIRLKAEHPELKTFENHYRRKDGSAFWGKLNVRQVVDSKNRLLFFEGFIEDITDRKRAEDELRESETRYKNIFENNHAVMLIIDPDKGKIEDANPAACAYYGWRREELLNKKIDEINTLTTAEVHAEMQLARDERRNHFYFKHRRADDSIRDVEVYSGPLALKGRTLLYSIVHDINERKRAEEELEEGREKYRGLSEAAFEAIFISEKGRCIEQNQTAEKIFGYTSEEAVGRYGTEWIAPEDREMVMKNMLAGYEEPYEATALKKDGTTFPCLLRGKMMHYKGRTVRVTSLSDISARKRTEEALHESRVLLFNAFNQSPLLMTISDLTTGKYLEVNDSFCRVSEFSREEVIGKTSLELGWLSVDERTRLVHGLQQHGKITGFELTLRSKSGKTILCRYSGDIIQTSEGDKLFTTAEDITERKQADEALRKSESTYRTLVETSPDAITLTNMEGRILACNSQTARLHGFERVEELIGQNVAGLIAPHEVPRMFEGLRQLLLQGGVNHDEFVMCRKNEPNFTGELNIALILDEAGSPMSVVGISRDITDRKRAEDALRTSEEKFRKMFEASPDAISITQVETATMLDINPSFERLLGYTREELLGQRGLAVQLWKRPEERVRLASILFQNRFVSVTDLEFCRKSGETFIADASFSIIEINGKEYSLAIISDITERKQAEAKIQATLEEKETLLREVHHRVKNNLQVIIALIKMQARVTPDAGTQQFLRELEGQAFTMALVYEQLYQSENLARVSMASYLRQLTSKVLDTYGRRNALRFHLDAALFLDVAQATPCGLIVNELLTNILKHAFPPDFKEEPTVSITLRQDGETCHLTVSDNGTGLPPGHDGSTSPTLGLRLVNLWATHQLGGTLAVTGETGTTFNITFGLEDWHED